MSTRPHRVISRIIVACVIAWVASCSDSPTGQDHGGGPPPRGLTVSDAVPGSNVAYVSLAPGSVPDGLTATIRSLDGGRPVTTAVTDGGFDPVAVPVQGGTAVLVTITQETGPTVRDTVVVPARQPPHIVRSAPGGGKTGTPLNSVLSVVFSEPVAGPIAAASVQLLRGTTAVAGTVRFRDVTQVTVEFVPAAPLDGNTDYRLTVPAGVADLEGDVLATPLSVPFTTGTGLEGPVAAVTVLPQATPIAVGSVLQLTVVASDAEGTVLTGRVASWSSDAPVIARVAETGVVSATTADTVGFATITAAVEGVSGTTSVLVEPRVAPVASVAVAPDTARVFVGNTTLLSAMTQDSAGTPLSYRLITWGTSDAAVATLAPLQGVTQGFVVATVTAGAPGVARITATSEGRVGSAIVKVTRPLVVTIQPSSASVLLGQTVQLTAFGSDSSGNLQALDGTVVSWASSDATVAHVDGMGRVTGLIAGTATITATYQGHVGTSAITVNSLRFASVSAGGEYACGLTTDSATYCWGSAYDGTVVAREDCGGYSCSRAPVAIPTTVTFASLTTGLRAACGLTADGAAYCWGKNDFGQVGDGTTNPTIIPVAVAGGLRFTSLSAGDFHTCGITASGAAYCWGVDEDGQLGAPAGLETCAPYGGSLPCSKLPVAVSGGLSFVSIAAGGSHTCGVTVARAAYCWGNNFYGQLGNGAAQSSLTPVAVAGGLAFEELGAGEYHTCGVTTTGAAYCWGTGALGDTMTTKSPTPLAVLGGYVFVTLSAGGYHTCAITSAGVGYCWGPNDWGKLGDGSTTGTLTPRPVAGGFTFATISGAQYHTCGLTVGGVAYCWGRNAEGELGDGTMTNSSNVPVKVAGQP